LFITGFIIGAFIIVSLTSYLPANEYKYTIIDTIDGNLVHHFVIYTHPSFIVKFQPTKIYTYRYDDQDGPDNIPMSGVYDKYGNGYSGTIKWIWSCHDPNLVLHYMKLYGPDTWETYLAQKIYYEPVYNYFATLSPSQIMFDGYPLELSHRDALSYGFIGNTRIIDNLEPRDTSISDNIYNRMEQNYLGSYAT
jgi:hypothetical protein